LLSPIVRDGIRRTGKPLLVATQLVQGLCGKKLGGVACRVPERLEQALANQHGDLVLLEAEVPCRLSRVQPRWRDLPTHELRLLLVSVHARKDRPIWGKQWCIADTRGTLAAMHVLSLKSRSGVHVLGVKRQNPYPRAVAFMQSRHHR